MAAKFPDGIEHAVQAHRAASMALPDAHNPSQASFPGDPDDSAARSQALHPHPATHSHARRTLGGPRNHHHYSYHGHNGEHLSVTSQPTNPSRVGSPFSHYEATMHEHDRKFAYQSQIQEDRNYALALAHDAPSSEIPVIRSGVLPHSVLLSSKLSSARSGQRAYILIPPLLNAILLGGVPLPPPVVLAASHLCPLTRGGGGGVSPGISIACAWSSSTALVCIVLYGSVNPSSRTDELSAAHLVKNLVCPPMPLQQLNLACPRIGIRIAVFRLPSPDRGTL